MPPTDPNFVATADPDFVPAPTAQADPDFVPAPAPPPAQPKPLVQRVAEGIAGLPGMQMASGFVKGAEKSGAGLIEAANKFSPPIGANPDKTKAGLQDVADWLRTNTNTEGWEKAGDIGETVAELVGGGAGVEATELGGKALSFGDRLMTAAKQAKILETHPAIRAMVRAGLDATKAATRGAAEMGGQTFVKTGGDTQAAESSAEGGAAVGGVFGAIGSAIEQSWEALSDFAQKNGLNTRTVAGADIPVDADGNLRAPALARGTVDPATTQADTAMQTIGQRGVANSLRRSNNLRAQAVVEPIPIARRLPAPEASAQGFQVGTTPPVEEVNQPSQQGDSRLTDWQANAPEGDTAHPANIQYTPPAGGDGSVTRGGGGPLILTADGQASSIERARALQNHYQTIMDHPDEMGDIGQRQQAALKDAHADLTEQIRRYDDYAASQPNIPAHNIPAAINSTTSIGAGAQQLMDAVRPFFAKGDALTGGAFGALRKQANGLQTAIRSSTGTADRMAKMADLDEVNQKISDLFDQNRTQMNPDDWTRARQTYQDGATMMKLHNFIESHFNGVTTAEAARNPNLQRVFQPKESFNQGLEKLYSDPKTGPVLQRTIGQGSMDDLKDLGQLFAGADRQAATKSLLQNVGSAIKRHYYGIQGIAGAAAYGLEHSLGAGVLAAGAGHLAAGTTTGVSRYITERIASDPVFAKRFIYAVKNSVGPRIAAPLLSSMILHGTQQPKPAAQPGDPQ